MPKKPVEDWRVLLVDDDEDDYLITYSMLSQSRGRKIALEWASTFQEAQKLLESNNYSAVLVDYDLGRHTGIELIREYVARGYSAPLILYTGRGGYEVDMEAMQAGATLYLSKTEATPHLLERSLRYAIERKRIEAELDRRLKERSDILESIQDGFLAIDHDWRITYINRRAAGNGGFEPEELHGRVIWEAFPRLRGTLLERNYRYVMNERAPVQFEMQGVYQDLWYNVSIYPSLEGISVFWQDISARKQADQAAQRSLAQLRAVIDNMSEGLIVADGNGEILLANPAMIRQAGWEEAPKENLKEYDRRVEVRDPAGRLVPRQRWPLSLALKGQSVRDVELSIHRHDTGKDYTALYSAEPVFGDSGRVELAIVTVRDITARKLSDQALQTANQRLQEQAEELEVQSEELRMHTEELLAANEQLRRSQDLLQAVTDNTPDAIFLKDEHGRLLIANPAMLRIIGKPEKTVLGKTDRELYSDPAIVLESMETDRRVMESGRTETIEETLQTPEGYRLFLTTRTPWRDASGRVNGLIGISRDITERRQADEALRRYELLSAHSRDIILFMRREDGRLLEANAAAAQAYGYNRAELLGLTIHDLRDPGTRGLTAGQMAQADAGGILFETSHRRKDGSTFPVEVSSQGATIGGQRTLISVIRDITGRIQAEQAIRSSQQDLARAQAVAHTGSWRLDVRQDKLMWSDETYRIFGIPVGTPMTYEAFLAAVHPEDRDFVDSSWAAALRGEPYNVEHRIVVGDQVKWVRERAELEFDPQGLLLGGFGTVQDITEHKRVEAALRESEDRFRQLAEAMPQLVWSADADGSVDYYNRRHEEFLGFNQGADGRWRWTPVMHPEDLPRTVAAWRRAVETGEIYEIEHRVQRRDGSFRWYLSRAMPVLDQNGRVVKWYGTATDVHDLKQMQAALRESEQRYRSLFNGMTEGFAIHEVITDAEGRPCDYRFLDINPAFERLTGLQREDVLGRTHNEVLPDNDPRWIRIYGEVALTGKPVHFEEYSPPLKRHYEVFAYRPAPNQFAVIFMDVTERKQAEQALQAYAEKLQRSNEALEDFAFIASHDLREPLRKVQAFGDLLGSHCSQDLDERGRDYIARMQAAAGRMESMLDGLLIYSRVTTQGRPFTKVDLYQIAFDVLSDLEVRVEQTGAQVKIENLPVIEADALQMRLLLQNLLGNALKFHRPGVPPQVVISYRTAAQDRIELSVEDNGIGFDMNFVDHLFQPFHRLIEKSAYEGTGMGLAICRKIVERHGGSISARSEPDKGSIFLVTLPCESCS